MAGQNFTDRQLAGLERSSFGRWQTTVVKLIAELRAERSLNRQLVEQALRARAQLVAMDRPTKPGGRVLLVDCPATPDELCEGETVVYADTTVDLCTARSPVGVLHPRFDSVLEAVLAGARWRFRTMPGELSVKTRSLARYPRDFPSEVAALVNAKVADNVLAALNELREGLEDEKNEAQTKEQETSGDGADTPEESITVPF